MRNGQGLGGLHLLGVCALAGWLCLALFGPSAKLPVGLYLGVTVWEWLLLLAAWRWVRNRSEGDYSGVILAWAFLFRICGYCVAPIMDDDYYRFLWDGRQLAHLKNPYATAPADHFGDTTLSEPWSEILNHINYPHVPTIYGPVCQVAFLISYWIAPGAFWPWKLILGLAEFGIFLSVRRWTKFSTAGRELSAQHPTLTQATLILGWTPLAVFETSFNAHPDAISIAFLVGAITAVRQGRITLGGLLCGLAIGGRIWALLLVPFLLLRSSRAWVAFGFTLLAVNAPFWIHGRATELQGLLQFAREWEFNSSVFALLRMAWNVPVAKAACAVAFLSGWTWLWWRWNFRRSLGIAASELPPGVWVYGLFLCLSATVNPWYLLWLLPFVALQPSSVALAGMAWVSLSYLTHLNLGLTDRGNFEHPAWVRPLEYGGWALTTLLANIWWRKRFAFANGQVGSSEPTVKPLAAHKDSSK